MDGSLGFNPVGAYLEHISGVLSAPFSFTGFMDNTWGSYCDGGVDRNPGILTCVQNLTDGKKSFS